MGSNNGRLGIRDLHLVNQSLSIHAAWNIASNKDSFLTSILKSKYFPNSNFWKAPSTSSRDLSSGHPFYKLGKFSRKIVLSKFIKETLVSGPLLGVPFGTTFMITLTLQSIMTTF